MGSDGCAPEETGPLTRDLDLCQGPCLAHGSILHRKAEEISVYEVEKGHCVKGERFGELLERLGPRTKEGLIPAKGTG